MLYLCFINFSFRIQPYWFLLTFTQTPFRPSSGSSSSTLLISTIFFLQVVSLLEPRLANVTFLSRVTFFFPNEGRKPILTSNEFPRLASVLVRSVGLLFALAFICFPEDIKGRWKLRRGVTPPPTMQLRFFRKELSSGTSGGSARMKPSSISTGILFSSTRIVSQSLYSKSGCVAELFFRYSFSDIPRQKIERVTPKARGFMRI